METTHKCDNIPCPENLNAKTANGSKVETDNIPIKQDAELNKINMAITKVFALYLSALVKVSIFFY